MHPETTRLRAHVLFEPDDGDRELLMAELRPGIRVTTGKELPEDGAAVEVLAAGVPTGEQLEACPALRVLLIPYAGVPLKTRELMPRFPEVAVHNLHHNSRTAAEMTMALLLAASKMVLPMDRALREGRWSGRGEENPAVLLTGKTVLILGYGAIGRRVAVACRALGMEAIATRRRIEAVAVENGVTVHPAAAMRDLLPRAHVVVVAVPLTPETEPLLSARELDLLPEGAVLVNVARGPVVSEKALYEALRSGRLHSAGLDVWYRYPGRDGNPEDTPPSEYPFHELDNVVMSPHRGGWLHEVEAYRMRDLAAFLNAAAEGGPLPHPVDLTAGY